VKEIDIDSSIYCLTFVSMIHNIYQVFDLVAHVEDYFFKSTMIFAIQFLIMALVFYAALTDEDGLQFQ